jgi:hypothetical protein
MDNRIWRMEAEIGMVMSARMGLSQDPFLGVTGEAWIRQRKQGKPRKYLFQMLLNL